VSEQPVSAPALDFRALFEAVPDCQAVLTPDLRVVAATDSYLRAAGQTRPGFLGGDFFAAFPGAADRGVLVASFQRVLQSGRPDSVVVAAYWPPPESGQDQRRWRSTNRAILGPDGAITHLAHSISELDGEAAPGARPAAASALPAAASQAPEARVGRLPGDRKVDLAGWRARAAVGECLLWEATVQRRTDWLHWRDPVHFEEAAAERFLPVERAAGETYLAAWRRARHPGDDRRTNEFGLAEIGAGRSYLQEFRVRRRDGCYRWLSEEVHVRTTAPGEWRVTGVAVDVTDRKRAEGALFQTEASLRAAAAVGPTVTWEHELSTDRVCWSEGLEEMFGLAPRSFDGRFVTLLAAVDPDDRDRLAATRDLPVPGGSYREEFRLAAPGGSRWLEARGAVIVDDGRLPRLLSVATDVTLRKEAAETLRASRERMDRMLHSIQVGLWYLDLPSGQLIWNDTCREHFGLPPRAAVTLAVFWERLHPEDLGPTREAMERAIATSGSYDVVYRTVAPGKPERWIRAIGSAYADADGEPAGFDGITVDVSDQKRVEHALHEADRRKDEFLAMLAHELRNPLAPIVTAVQILQLRGVDDPVLDRQQAVIARQARHMARLLDDLLDVSRITRGKIELRRARVDLRDVVEPAVEASRSLLEARDLQLSVTLAPEPIMLDADAARLQQVIGNLLNNAARYTPPGGCVQLTVSRSSSNGESGVGPAAVLRVRDSGVGIPPETLPQIFDLFVQGDRSLARSEGGLGIGLTLVQRLVELHGGRVDAHSTGPGQGSEFVVRLPLAGSARSAERAEDPAGSAGGAPRPPDSLRVLIVEDNADAAATMRDLLDLWGHDVRVAVEGVTALALAAEHRPHVVLLDLGLPGMDGYQVAEQLRARVDLPPPQLVAVTGYGQETDRRRAREAGFHHHLVKPLDAATLRGVLAAVERPSAAGEARQPPHGE
jgi:two-component system CheB/CheR fusion protein